MPIYIYMPSKSESNALRNRPYMQLQYNLTQLGMSQDDSAALKDTEVRRIEAADACSSIKHVLQQFKAKNFETNTMSYAMSYPCPQANEPSENHGVLSHRLARSQALSAALRITIEP